MDYFNELTGSRCAALAPFEKALSTVKSKDQCYTAEELKLVIRWAHVNWGHSFKPENLCRMTRFDGYLSDALIWADGHGSNPKACPHEEIIKLWNENSLRRPFHCMSGTAAVRPIETWKLCGTAKPPRATGEN